MELLAQDMVRNGNQYEDRTDSTDQLLLTHLLPLVIRRMPDKLQKKHVGQGICYLEQGGCFSFSQKYKPRSICLPDTIKSSNDIPQDGTEALQQVCRVHVPCYKRRREK